MSTPSSRSKPLKRLSLLQSATSLPSPSSSSFASPSIASYRFDLSEQQPSTSAQPSPVSSISPPTAATSAENGAVKNARRQSSIYYVSQDRDSDRGTNLETRTPANARSPSTPQHDNISENAGLEAKNKRHSLGAVGEQAAPMTLVEKHADLLRFIAQKESRCLELRSQLATEEAELQALKRKWERIMGRRVTAESLISLSSSDTESLAQNNVLAGLKEGVQGVGRLLAHLGDLGAQSKETDHGHASNSSISTMVSSSSTRLSQSSISSPGVTSDGVSALCSDLSEESKDPCAGKRHSISTPVRRRPYEPSSPGTPSPPILTPRTPQSASFAHAHSFPPKLSRSHSTTSTQTQAKHMKRLSAAAGSFPPVSSIPGVNVAPLASWVEDVGKRLIGQVISVTDTALSSGKRDSIRSDISSPVVTSPTRTSQNRPRVIDLSSLDSPSLLDDDDGLDSRWAGMTALSPDQPKPSKPVLSPISPGTNNGELASGQGSVRVSDDDGEEWNW